MNKFDIVRFVGKSKSPIDAKTGEIAIITEINHTNTQTLIAVNWKEGNRAKKLAWFDVKEFELVKKFEW